MITTFTKNLLRRTTVAIAAVATSMFASNVAAQSTVTLSGSSGNTCQYSSMSVLPNGNVQVSCNSVGGNEPGTFTLSLPTNGTVGTSVTATVLRSGGSTGAISLNYNATGQGCTVAAGTVNFANSDANGKTFNVAMGSTAGQTCVVALSPPTPTGTLGSPNQVTMTATTGQQQGGDPNCPAVPLNIVESALIQSGLNTLRMTSGQVATLPLPPVAAPRKSGVVKLGETTISPDPVTTELSISKCKGQVEATSLSPIAPGCYKKSQQRNLNKIQWMGQVVAGVDQNYADFFGYCLAYESEGAKWVNVRYTYATCQNMPCGFNIQTTDGTF